MELNQQVIQVLNRLKTADIKAYVVGGYVRDLLLNKESFDVDICFHGDVDLVMNALSEYEFDLSAQVYESVSFKVGEYQFECTHLRMEEGSKNHRHPDVIVKTDSLMNDLKRRDFTMNTICYSLDEGLIDLYQGVKDLKQGVLRTVGDPNVRFDEDYLRMFRSLRFQSEFGFDNEKKTDETLLSMVDRLVDYPVVWWQKEFEKMLLGKYFLKVGMAYPQFFDVLFGHFKAAYLFDQRNPYHEYCLYEHTMRVVDALPLDLNLRYAGLFHDLGKMHTEVHDDKGVSHYQGHAEVSYEMSIPILNNLSMKARDRKIILNLIRYHGIRMEPGFHTVYQLAYKHGVPFVKDLILIKKADNLSKSTKAYYQVDKCDAFLKDLEVILKEKWPLEVRDLKVGYQECHDLGVDDRDVSKILKKVIEEVVKIQCGNDKEKQLSVLQGVVSNVIYTS